ncbi:MAG: hypothetical protein WAM60_24145 [Candidatus Promineifilaceae bacterium]
MFWTLAEMGWRVGEAASGLATGGQGQRVSRAENNFERQDSQTIPGL